MLLKNIVIVLKKVEQMNVIFKLVKMKFKILNLHNFKEK